MTIDYLIIGTGIAGVSAAKTIRKRDGEGRIVMVSNETMKPYYRIKLTKAISKDLTAEDLLLDKEGFYEENRIELILNKQVESVDYEGKRVILEDGESLAYKKLLLATGATPFIPPHEGGSMENVFSMRRMEDYLAVQKALNSGEIKTILVVGGGLLGLEAAYAFLEKGFEVHVGEFSDHLLTRQLDTESSIALEKALAEEGLKIHIGSTLKENVGDKKVEKVRMTGGEEFDCQLVLFSVGVRSDIRLAGETLAKEKGIVVNEKLETGMEGVWAAGDNAQINGMTMGLWTAAKEMGEIAGENMAGGEALYSTPKLFTNLQLGNIKLFSAGSHDGDDMFVQHDGENYVKLFFKENKTIGGILGGKVSKMGLVKDLIAEGAEKETAEEAFI